MRNVILLFFANQSVAVIGSGHSALNSLLELVSIKAHYPETEIHWILRKSDPVQAYGGEDKDALEGRGALGSRIRQLVERDQIRVHSSFKTQSIESKGKSFDITAQDGRSLHHIDQLIVNAGSRPDFSFLEEVRLDIDPVTESSRILAPLIDPNLHSCGLSVHMGKRSYVIQIKDFIWSVRRVTVVLRPSCLRPVMNKFDQSSLFLSETRRGTCQAGQVIITRDGCVQRFSATIIDFLLFLNIYIGPVLDRSDFFCQLNDHTFWPSYVT